MRRIFYCGGLTLSLLFTRHETNAQMGVGTGLFVPTTGYVANVFGPLTLRGFGFTINKIINVETGFTVYSMPGNAVTHLPVKSEFSLFGPSTTLLVPLELGYKVRIQSISITVRGGGFMFYNFTHRLNEGNFDRYIRMYEGWDIANSDFSYTNHPGFGWIAGTVLEYHVNKKLGVYVSWSFLDGESKLDLKGTYSGGNIGGVITTKDAPFKDATLSIRGSEFGIGVHF